MLGLAEDGGIEGPPISGSGSQHTSYERATTITGLDDEVTNYQLAGRMFWLMWNKFCGSYSALTRVNRS